MIGIGGIRYASRLPSARAMRRTIWYCSNSVSYSLQRALGDQDGLRQVARVDDDPLSSRRDCEREHEDSDGNEFGA